MKLLSSHLRSRTLRPVHVSHTRVIELSLRFCIRCFHVPRLRSRSSRSSLMRLMEPPECRYQFHRDSRFSGGQPRHYQNLLVSRPQAVTTTGNRNILRSSFCADVYLIYLARKRDRVLRSDTKDTNGGWKSIDRAALKCSIRNQKEKCVYV